VIKRVHKEGNPKDIKTEIAVNEILKEINEEQQEYLVGIDYTTLGSEDYTVIAKFIEGVDGNLINAGVKLVKS
jgi:hypothetical protein